MSVEVSPILFNANIFGCVAWAAINNWSSGDGAALGATLDATLDDAALGGAALDASSSSSSLVTYSTSSPSETVAKSNSVSCCLMQC